jgi:hypothetical protein
MGFLLTLVIIYVLMEVRRLLVTRLRMLVTNWTTSIIPFYAILRSLPISHHTPGLLARRYMCPYKHSYLTERDGSDQEEEHQGRSRK